jgi:hypothetical protein
MTHPGPGNRDRTLTISQRDHQELVGEAHFGPIHDQAHLLERTGLGLDPLTGNRIIPITHLEGRVIQKSAQAAGQTRQFSGSRDFASYTAQTDRAALVDPNQQPNEVADLGNPLGGSQFLNATNPGMIKGVDRHLDTPGVKGFAKTHFTGEPLPINYFVVKVSGR